MYISVAQNWDRGWNPGFRAAWVVPHSGHESVPECGTDFWHICQIDTRIDTLTCSSAGEIDVFGKSTYLGCIRGDGASRHLAQKLGRYMLLARPKLGRQLNQNLVDDWLKYWSTIGSKLEKQMAQNRYHIMVGPHLPTGFLYDSAGGPILVHLRGRVPATGFGRTKWSKMSTTFRSQVRAHIPVTGTCPHSGHGFILRARTMPLWCGG